MSKYWTLGSALLVSAVIAQEVYVPTDGPTTRDNCPAEPEETQPPEYTFTPYSHVLTETLRYATSIAPSSTTGSYARPSEELASLVPSLSYTTWGAWDPEATATPTEDTEDPYGQAEWTKLWEHANPPNFTAESTSLYSTTVSPTPIPSNELVLPARDYFGPTDCYNFPPGFRFGVASSASQIEGATAQEGKAPSLMDILVHDDRPKAYVTNEHYYLYKQDIERVAAIGVKYFSFSIAWTRILPFALPGTPVNQKGIDHYDDVINFIIEKGMTPVVTLLHFDSPLQFYGDDLDRAKNPPPEGFGYQDGGYNNQTFQDAFVHYAKVVMTHYADRVPVWFTFNEPLLYSVDARAIDNVVRAHARVYHFYKEELKGEGQISFKLNNNFGLPLDPTSEGDVAATSRRRTASTSSRLGRSATRYSWGRTIPSRSSRTGLRISRNLQTRTLSTSTGRPTSSGLTHTPRQSFPPPSLATCPALRSAQPTPPRPTSPIVQSRASTQFTAGTWAIARIRTSTSHLPTSAPT